MAFANINVSLGQGANAGTQADIYILPRAFATITRTAGVITGIAYTTPPTGFKISVAQGFVKPKFEMIDGFRTFKQSISFPINDITAAVREALLDAFDGNQNYFVLYYDNAGGTSAGNGSWQILGCGNASNVGFGRMTGLTRDPYADGGALMVTLGHTDGVGEDVPYMPVQIAPMSTWLAANIIP